MNLLSSAIEAVGVIATLVAIYILAGPWVVLLLAGLSLIGIGYALGAPRGEQAP